MWKIVGNYLNWSKKFPSKNTDKDSHVKCTPITYRQATAAKMVKPQESKVLQKITGEVSFIKQDI